MPITARFCLAALLAVAAAPSTAQEAEFFKGKTVTLNIGSSTGGGLDTYGRLVSRHFGKHIPGNPTVVAANAPGAGGKTVAGRLFNVSPKDGTHLGITFPGVLVEPLLIPDGRSEFDPTRFNYVGNAHAEVLVCFVRADSPAKTPKDLLSNEIVLGATAPGSTTWDYPLVSNGVLGTKLKIVTGYKGAREVTLAIERGEVQGICGVGFGTIKVQYPDVLSGTGFAKIFAQEDMKGHPELNKTGVPHMIALAKTPQDRAALQMLYAQSAFSRPLILPPGVPAERVATLRKAFLQTMKDPELLAEAKKMNIDVLPSSGEEVQAEIAQMYKTAPDVIDRVNKAMARK